MRTLGTALAALLLVGACSSDPTPREPTVSATTPTPSVTPTAVVPTMPKQAGEDSPEGAAAFVKHWVDVFNYAAATGDVEELSRLSSPDCKGCQNYIQLYRDTYAAGGYFKGGDWTLGGLELRSEGQETLVTTRIQSDPSRFRRSNDEAESAGKAVDAELTFGVVGEATHKRVSQIAHGAKS